MMTTPVRWRKSSRSQNLSECVELAWRKSSRSQNTTTCIELAYTGMVRDSKNPTGPMLNVELTGLLAAVKSCRLDR